MSNFSHIQLLALDVDGVLTDGKLYYGAEGDVFKAFHAHDGHGLVMLREAGVQIAIITARQSEIVSHRMQELQIPHVFQGQKDKRRCLQTLLNKLNIDAKQTAYVGDDVMDIPAMELVGLRCTVNNAMPAVKAISHYITKREGGMGAVREICDMLIAHRDHKTIA